MITGTIFFFIILYAFTLRFHHEEIKQIKSKVNALEQKNKKMMGKA